MRWTALFADLEAEAAALAAAELDAEVRDRVRREMAQVRLQDRLAPAVGALLRVRVMGAGPVAGRLLDAGPDWLLLEEPGREVLVPYAALQLVTGLGAPTAVPGSEGEVGRHLDLRWALRALARGRAGAVVVLRDGATVSGTVDRAGADHVEVAEHAAGEPRRPASVRAVTLVPLTALSLVRSV